MYICYKKETLIEFKKFIINNKNAAQDICLHDWFYIHLRGREIIRGILIENQQCCTDSMKTTKWEQTLVLKQNTNGLVW